VNRHIEPYRTAQESESVRATQFAGDAGDGENISTETRSSYAQQQVGKGSWTVYIIC